MEKRHEYQTTSQCIDRKSAHAAALLLRRSKAVILGFLDLHQRTTLPRTDACRDDPKGGCDVPLRQDSDRACAHDGDARRRVGTNGRPATRAAGATGEPDP